MARPRSSSSRSRTAGADSLHVTRIHPLIRRELATIDLRRTEIVRVQDGVAVEVIVRNSPTR